KWPGDDGIKHIHQDWSFVDEDLHRSVGLWVPLVDVDEANGTLYVLPGSHRVLRQVRPAPGLPAGAPNPVTELDFDDLDPVPLRVGQAIAYDQAVVHGSPPNRTDAPRPAVALNFAPRAAPL